LFWTIAVPSESVTIDLDNATASLEVADVAVTDAHDLANALTNGKGLTNPPIPPIAPVPATVSFAVQWSRVVSRANVTNQASGFTGEFIETIATIKWSASQSGFDFESEDPNPDRNFYSVIGHERNGVFFHQG
jgi:hypothetical protein